MKTNTKQLKLITLISICIIKINAISIAQESFLLSKSDMVDYKLVSQDFSLWGINDSTIMDTSKVVEQRWLSLNDEYYIKYCEFDSEMDALKGTAYEANSFAMRYVFGSPTGELIGNTSWVALDGSALYFQKWNVGIKIFKSVNFKPEDRQVLFNLASKIILKITENISSEILAKEKDFVKYELSITNYERIVAECSTLFAKYGYSDNLTENTKWIISQDSLSLGIRKEWTKDKSFFSINIAKYLNEIEAQKSSNNMSEIFNIPFFSINNDDSIIKAINNWCANWKIKDTVKYFSMISQYNNLSILFYYYNTNGIDVDFLKSIVKNTYDGETAINDAKCFDIIVYPNPSNDFIIVEKSNNNLEKNIIKVFDLNGQEVSVSKAELSNSYKIDMTGIPAGIYFLTLQTSYERKVKKIIKKN